MTWTATTEEAPQPIPEGTYAARVVSISDFNSQYGPATRIDFTIQTTDDEIEGLLVSGLASKILNEKSKLGRWTEAILGYKPAVGQEITADDLLEKECRVVVRHKATANGSVYAKVVQVLAAADVDF